MALSGCFVRRIVGGGVIPRSIEWRRGFMRLNSTLTSPKLFVTGVTPSTTDEKIREAFSPFGNLVEAKVIKDRFSGISKGFAIVTYDNIQQAYRARNRMNLKRWGDTVLLVETESEFYEQEPTVFPKSGCSVHLDLDDWDEYQGVLDLTTEDKLREAFAPFGNVLEARSFIGGRYGNLKRRAIVRYGTREEAENAKDALEDIRLGHQIVVPVEPKKFKPSEQEKTHSDTSYITHRTSGYTQSTHYHTEAKAEGGKNIDKGEVKKPIIKKGDIISLKDLLFTKNRDYLVKNNNEHIKAEQLEGKVIVIYLLPLYVDFPQLCNEFTSLLKEVYYDLLPNNNFEVVFVANYYPHAGCKREIIGHPSHVRDPQKLFEDLFSSMPWTAIPYSDAITRKSLQRFFGSGVYKEHSPITYFVVDSTGMVLQCGDWVVFEDFGALGYPFSDKRLEFIRAQDDAAAKQSSLKALLATPERDYVISNEGDKTPLAAEIKFGRMS